MTKTIMIVDDEPSIRTSLEGVLEDEGYKVLCASDGKEALKTMEEQMPDLPTVSPEVMGSLKTLGQIVDYLSESSGDGIHQKPDDQAQVRDLTATPAEIPSNQPDPGQQANSESEPVPGTESAILAAS